ncbi:MAG: peptide ABC transporter substrate-binding protein [Aggregatilineales bacterium]
MKRASRLISLLVLAALLLAVVGGVGGQSDYKVLRTGLSMVGADLETIDPALAQTVSQIEIINQMFIGLTHQNNLTASVEPGIATWEVSEDGLVYTFSIIPEIPWVRYNADTGEVEMVMDEEGRPRRVTAQDFVFGWRRTLDPATGGAYSYVLAGNVAGGNEFNAGEVGPEALGIVALDEHTLQVTAAEPVAFAVSIFGLWMARAQPEWAIEEAGDLWTEPEYINTYGPYTLKEWAHDESITLIKNPFWPGTETVPQARIDEIIFRFLSPAAQFAEFQAGNLDASSVPLEEIPRIEADPVLSQQYTIGTNPCTYYVGFDVTEAPVDNVHLRRALSAAIDRVAIVENVTRGGQIAAQWFSRPGLTAAPTLETHPDLGMKFDLELAQAEMALALETMGLSSPAELPTLVLTYNDAAGHAAIMQAMQQMWVDAFGVNVELSQRESAGYFSGLRQDAPMMYRAGWCQDYSDASNFLYDVFRSDSEFNYTGYANPEFDALVDRARVLRDEAERLELYVQAEEILINEGAAIIPIYWYTTNQLTAPNVERTYSITGNEYYYFWDIN